MKKISYNTCIISLLFLTTLQTSPATSFLPPKARTWFTKHNALIAGGVALAALFVAWYKPWQLNWFGNGVITNGAAAQGHLEKQRQAEAQYKQQRADAAVAGQLNSQELAALEHDQHLKNAYGHSADSLRDDNHPNPSNTATAAASAVASPAHPPVNRPMMTNGTPNTLTCSDQRAQALFANTGLRVLRSSTSGSAS